MMKNMMVLCFIVLLGIGLIWFFTSCKNNAKNTSGIKKLDYGFTIVAGSVQFYDEPVAGADAVTFTVLDEYYCKDHQAVYFHRSYRESKDYLITKKHYIHILEGADAGSFISLGYGYAKDKTRAWNKDQTWQLSDVASMKVLDYHFVKDKKNVYLDGHTIAGIESTSFQVLNEHYAKDSMHFYFIQLAANGGRSLQVIPGDHTYFTILDYPYSKDNKHVFYLGKVLSGADAATFIIIGDSYAKDHQHVYYRASKVNGADPVSFTLFKENESSLGETVYARDKNGIYVNDRYFDKADLGSFTILNEKYTMDKNAVYYKMEKVKNADIASFKVYPHYMGDADAEDKNHKYGDGKIVE
jgi:hypothetical protein